MLRRNLAEKLVSLQSNAERARLLSENISAADIELAYCLKEICYECWTTEPTKAQGAAQALKSLLTFNRHRQIEALSLWVSGIADLTRGNLDVSAGQLEKSFEIFNSINLEHEAAQTIVARLIPLALLGRYEEAVEAGQIALKIFEKNGDELAAAKIEMNLGNIVSRQEQHRAAEKFYLAARRRYVKLNEPDWQTMAENGLAITYAALNDFRRAEKFYTQALTRAQSAQKIVTEAEIEASIGTLSFFRGKFDVALKFLENSRQKYAALQMPHQTAVAELEIADVYLELNLAEEALTIYENITGVLGKLKLQGEEARARANFARAALLQNDYPKAKRELKKSARLYALENNRNGAAAVKLTEANLEFSRRKFKRTLTILDETETLLQTSENLRLKLSAGWLRGEALRCLKKPDEAERIFNEVYRLAIKNEQPDISRICLNSLGNIALQKNDLRPAERFFKKAIKIIETLRAPLPAEEFRMAFLENKLAPYESLTKIYLKQKRFKKAFLSTESSRARTLYERLSFSPAESGGSSSLVRHLEDLREELNWFYSRLNRAKESEIKELLDESRQREKQIADVSRQIESIGQEFDQEKKGKSGREALDFNLLQKQLGKNKILIEFVCLENSFSAFVVSGHQVLFVERLAKRREIAELLENLHFQFGALRFGSKIPEKFIGGLKKRADYYLSEIYCKLLRPLESLIEDRDLICVPTDVLQYVPFNALRNDERYLIETREVTCVPSAAIWQFLNEKAVPPNERALLFGFADERIPLVDGELTALESVFEKTLTFAGQEATFDNFMKNAADFDVLHLACHGQFRADNPLFSSLHLADGWVTVRDICARNLNANLVTLSACETGMSKISAGDEILGFARGFLAAGANSLLLSLWTVNDAATTGLMKNFYINLQRGLSIPASLRFAQIEFIGRDAHPYFWSPFILIGR